MDDHSGPLKNRVKRLPILLVPSDSLDIEDQNTAMWSKWNLLRFLMDLADEIQPFFIITFYQTKKTPLKGLRIKAKQLSPRAKGKKRGLAQIRMKMARQISLKIR